MHHYKPLNKNVSYPGHVITINQKGVSKMHLNKPLNNLFFLPSACYSFKLKRRLQNAHLQTSKYKISYSEKRRSHSTSGRGVKVKVQFWSALAFGGASITFAPATLPVTWRTIIVVSVENRQAFTFALLAVLTRLEGIDNKLIIFNVHAKVASKIGVDSSRVGVNRPFLA